MKFIKRAMPDPGKLDNCDGPHVMINCFISDHIYLISVVYTRLEVHKLKVQHHESFKNLNVSLIICFLKLHIILLRTSIKVKCVYPMMFIIV